MHDARKLWAAVAAWALFLNPGFGFLARAEVILDINEPAHLKLRFEQVVVLTGDPESKVEIPLTFRIGDSGGPWRGLEFGALSPGNTGYRATVIDAVGARSAVADFRIDDARFDPLARLPISGDGVLAQTWDEAAGRQGSIEYVWNVNHAVGAGFGLFGTFEAMVVPEPGVRILLWVGAVALLRPGRGGKRGSRGC